jgi:hypothetical protein
MKIQLDARCFASRTCRSPCLPANLTAGRDSG